MSDEERVILSEWEREAFGRLAAALDDPRTLQRLTGAPRRQAFRFPDRMLGIVLLVVGSVLCVATFARWLWLGLLALGVMGIGGWLLWRDIEEAGSRRRR